MNSLLKRTCVWRNFDLETKEINLGDILSLIIKNIKIILVCVIIGGMGSFIISYFFISPKYISNTSLYVNNKESQSGNALNISDLTASQKLVNTYIVILKDDEVLNKVVERLFQEYSVEDLDKYIGLSEENGKSVLRTDSIRKMLTLTAVDNTEVLKIEAETKNAELSAKICSIISEEAPSVLQRIVKAGSVEVIGKPVIAFEKSSPKIKLNCLIGLFLGFIVAIGFIMVRYMLDRTIKGEEDLKELFDVPVLGEIPDFDCFKE